MNGTAVHAGLLQAFNSYNTSQLFFTARGGGGLYGQTTGVCHFALRNHTLKFIDFPKTISQTLQPFKIYSQKCDQIQILAKYEKLDQS